MFASICLERFTSRKVGHAAVETNPLADSGFLHFPGQTENFRLDIPSFSDFPLEQPKNLCSIFFLTVFS